MKVPNSSVPALASPAEANGSAPTITDPFIALSRIE